MNTFDCYLITVLLLLCASGLTDSEHIRSPVQCSIKDERFNNGHKYEYKYEVITTNGLSGTTTTTTDTRLSCQVVVSSPRKCELILEVLSCELVDRIPNKDFVINGNSERLAEELKQHPVYMQYNKGEVVNHQILVFDSEPQHVINIKKAIISLLQLKVISRSKTDGSTYQQHDLFGVCQTHMRLSPDSDHQVETYRDLLACNLSHVSNNPAGFLSSIKSTKYGYKLSAIAELTYPFEMNVTCKHIVTPALTIETAHCVQSHLYNPWLTSSGTQGSALIQISQHIKLESKISLSSRTVDHSLKGRIWMHLAMEFPMKEESFTSQNIMEKLEQIVDAFFDQHSMETDTATFSAASFITLVDTMRGASEKELRLTKETIYLCHNSSCHRRKHKTFEPKILQITEEKLFSDGLMSCGTDSCVAVFAICVRDGLLQDSEARSVVYNMGLFYQPSIKIVYTIFEYCKKIDTQGCWLSLSAMIHRLTSAVQSNVEINSVIFEIVSYIHKMIGNKCHIGLPDNLKLPEESLALEKLLTAIKAITNIGETAGSLYNGKLHKSKSLTSTLLQCIKNDHLSFTIARSAGQAIKSIGLQSDSVSQLLRVVEDEKRPVTLRTAIFDILIEHKDEETLRSLLNILNITKINNMQDYIMTRMSAFLDSVQPEFHELRIKLGEKLKAKAQPEFDDNMSWKSHYAQYNYQFTLPTVTLQTGGYLAVSLIFIPSSSVFQSFSVKIGQILDDKTVHLFDVIVDLEGMDTFIEMVNKKSNAHSKLTVQTILDLLGIVHKYIQNTSQTDMPKFAHYSSQISLALKQIFQLANMPKQASFPHAHLSLKAFGYEIGFISSDSLLLQMKQIHLNFDLKKAVFRVLKEGIETMLLKAFTVVDFHKVVPTVSGFPLETRIKSSFVAKTFVALDSDIENFTEKQINTHFVLRPRNDRSILHNDVEYQFSEPSLEEAFEKCLPDIYTQILGYKTCVSGVSYSFTEPCLRASSILVNPFKIQGILTPADSELNHYSLHLKYPMRTPQLQGYNMVARFEGSGQELSRQFSAVIDNNYDTGTLYVKVDIPDAGIRYNLEYVSFSNNDNYHNKYASVLSKHGKVLSSFVLEKKGSGNPKSEVNSKFMEYSKTKKSIHFNISFGALSLDISYKDYVPKPTNWLTDVTFSFHCEPKLELLYALHPDKHLAALQDHTSVLTCKQQTYDSKTSFAETWKGNNWMIINLPGQNITIRTDMIADLKGAHRVTDLYWKYGDKTDFIHMNSSVHNQSSADLFKFDYFLHLYSQDKLEVDIEGHVQGPRAAPLTMLNISTNISFSTPGKKSKPFLFVILSKIKSIGTMVTQEVSSVYEATKTKLFNLWREHEQKSDKKFTETNTEDHVTEKESQKSLLLQFLESLNWNVGIDTQIRMFPHILSQSGGRERKIGSEIQWFVNASMPRGFNQVFLVNGSFYKGKKHSVRLQVEDYLHDMKFNCKAEHSHTPEIFHHHHEWTMEDKNDPSFDHSFNFTVKYKHTKLFEYDLVLRSPWTKATHHINYTRISKNDLTVCAFAEVHSLEPHFDLLYHESVNVSKGGLVADSNLTSTFFDRHFHLTKLTNPDGSTIDGMLRLLSRLPILRGERTLSMSAVLPRGSPLTIELIYQCEDKSGINVTISLFALNKIIVGVKTLLDIKPSAMWTIELTESRYLQQTIECSPEMLNKVLYKVKKLRKLALDTVKHMSDMAVHYIQADFNDKTLPLINKSLEGLLTAKLQAAMEDDPNSKMAKLYKLTLGGVKIFNIILVDAPIALLIKGSHIDKALADSVTTFSNIVMDWTLKPPFLIYQFVQIYIQPVLKSKIVTFSVSLPFLMPAFNRVPQLTITERVVFEILKYRRLTVNKDIAVIFNGSAVRTFDGQFFHIADPPMPSCTYLLGADFRHGQFSLTYSGEGVTMFSSTFGLTMARDGSIFSNEHHISYLPFTSPDGQLSLSLHKGEIQLSFAEGLVDVTFNTENDLFLIEFDRKLKNASLGLLGTNNHESSDDFLLASGFKTAGDADFQNSYELTKMKKCSVTSLPSQVSCGKRDFPSCMSLSNKVPRFQSCLMMLNSQIFFDECQKAECVGQSGCSVVRAYFAACRHQGIHFGIPAVCGECQRKAGLDLLVVQSLHNLMIRDKDPMTAWRTFLASLGHMDLSVGLVTYGGAGEWKQPKLHILNSKLMEKGRKAVQFMHFTVNMGENETEADAAVLAAAEYPFRSQAAKVILLVHQRKPKQDKKSNANLLEVLEAKGITLVSASIYPEFEANKVEGILSAREVDELGGYIPSPQDKYSDVIISTSGMWLDLDMLNSLDTHKFQKIAEALARMNT